jgi:hypothetical protein
MKKKEIAVNGYYLMYSGILVNLNYDAKNFIYLQETKHLKLNRNFERPRFTAVFYSCKNRPRY